ncbi:hypothetical protein [Methylomonas sp. TEB]|jgi:hypothetical protein|uniref:hypothetical protein n=1 Tax=Methylomonas sp. TEB TaxID=3398229 RepID=UPI0039F549DE
MDDAQIGCLVAELETTKTSEEEAAWEQLRPLGPRVLPFLLEFYPRMKKWQGRVSLVFHAIPYARDYDDAFQLGIKATKDKATVVRYRACMLLAYSLKNDALPHLQALLNHSDTKTVDDAKAAIDAIERKNHNYFVDRQHSGKMFWTVGDNAA